MQLIVISNSDEIQKEIEAVHALFEAGMNCFHLRKPNYTYSDYEFFLRQIHEKYHHKTVLHDAFELTKEFNLKGIHHNKRNQSTPNHFQGTKSRSCHSIEELVLYKNNYDYVFLSPIFDSISKQNYYSVFNEKNLNLAVENQIINKKVIALGGITPQRISRVNQWGFGGVAVLGYVWETFSKKQNFNQLIEDFQSFQEKIKLLNHEI